MLGEGFLYKPVQGFVELFGICDTLKLVCKLGKGVCHDGVEDGGRACYRLARAGHPELKLVAGERNGRGAVAVGGVLRDRRQNINADAKCSLAALGVIGLGNDGIDDGLKLLTEEN